MPLVAYGFGGVHTQTRIHTYIHDRMKFKKPGLKTISIKADTLYINVCFIDITSFVKGTCSQNDQLHSVQKPTLFSYRTYKVSDKIRYTKT